MHSQVLICMMMQLLLLLPAMSSAVTSGDQCCLPMKWHSRMLKTSDKVFRYLQTGHTEVESARPLHLDIFVNHRRPRFEIRSATGGSSVVYWRGHMWLFEAGASWPRLMNAVAPGFRPSGGYAPLFFRCLAMENGFARVNSTHYRLTEPDETPAGKRLRLSTVTDVFVVPAAESKDRRATCRLEGFSVTSRYAKFVAGKGLAIVQDVDAYLPETPPRFGWPDQSLTQRARAYRNYYRSLLRSGGIRVNRPHLSVPVLLKAEAE